LGILFRDEGQLVQGFRLPDSRRSNRHVGFDCHIEFDEECWKLSKRLGRMIKFEKEHRLYFDPEVRARDPHAMVVVQCKKIWLVGEEKTLLELTRQRPRKNDHIWTDPRS